MSMLAEPKRKVRWGLNPRGNLWVNDNKKFGQKMLEKMGWNKGKGLGKHENGITENVKVTYKNDSKGIGWNDSDGNWIAHQDEFNAILSNLNKNLQEEMPSNGRASKNDESHTSSEVSLETRSKSFKSRVHYKKFVVGKDVSRYNEQDMDSIFGVKHEAHRAESSVSGKDKDDDKSENGSEVCDSFHDVQTYKSSSSVSDYFQSKMKARGLLNQSATCEKVTSASNKCEEKIEADKVPDLTGFETPVVSKKKKKDCKTRTKSFSASEEESKNVLGFNVCPPVSCEILPRESSKKRKYKIQPQSGETVCAKRMKTCPNEPVVTLAPNSLKSCLKKKSSTNSLKKTVKSVTFSDEHLSFPESVVSAAESNDTEHVQCSASTVLPVTSDKELSSESASGSKPLDCLENRKKPDKWSNDDSWSVSEKLALKMGHYRSILSRIKEHPVLSTTNLLEIKGYGNW